MKRILLVEDDRFLRRACEMGLRAKGHTVVTAVDGEEGWQIAQRESFDLVLLDMLMPKLSGIEVLQRLKADPRTASMPVIILSNSDRHEHVLEAKQLGAVDYLVKGDLSLAQLADKIAAFFGAPR